MDLRNSILATLSYYDIFDYSLTLVEVNRYLINPARVERGVLGVEVITLEDILAELERLVTSGRIQQINGFYSLAGRGANLYDLRIKKEKISTSKIKKLRRLAKWFLMIPYLRGVFISGSLSLNNGQAESDFDVLVIVKRGRLYTCRFLLSVLTSLVGARRGRYDLEAPDKFCFNHYLTDDNLNLTNESLYTAQVYSQLLPIINRENLVERFFAANRWLSRFFFNFTPPQKLGSLELRSKILSWLAGVGELLLNNSIGDHLELILSDYQQKRIRANPVTYESGGRTVFNEKCLEFHPRSFESLVINKYNSNLSILGITPPTLEIDSGLKSAV